MNPYASNREKCNCADSRPLNAFENVVALVVLVVVGSLASHGLITIAKQHGIVDQSGEYFWFEKR